MNVTKKHKKKTHSKTLKTNIKQLSFYSKAPEIIKVNGYSLLILPTPKKNVTLIDCQLLGGFYLETKEQAGISHLLEHVVSFAWKKCGVESCTAYWEKYGVQENAYTTISANSYWIKGLSEFFDKMLEYVVDIMLRPHFTQKRIDKEKTAVENELKSYINDPSWKLNDAVCKNLFTIEGMRYANDDKTQLKVLKTLTKKDLIQYCLDFYTKKNMLFIISTGIPKDKIISKFERLTAGVHKNETYNYQVVKSAACFQDKKKILFIKNSRAENTDIEICFPLYMYFDDKDFIYLDTITEIVGGDLSSLLVEILREKLELVYGASCYTITNMCGTVVYISISTLDKNITKVLEKTFEICKKYSKKLISTNKLLKMKREYKLEVSTYYLKDVELIKAFYTEQFLYQMHDEKRKIYTLKEKTKKILGLTKNKIRSIIMKMFDTKHCLIVYQGKKKVRFNIDNI
jgi:predicted Zn-dependent peptidase